MLLVPALTCFFMVLGPFSGPVALIVLCKLGLEESVQAEPESIITR